MSDVIIWHNPRCSKSRQTLAILVAQGINPVQRLYLKDAPNDGEIRAALTALNLDAKQLMRTGDATFKDLGLSAVSDDNVLVAAMVANPILIERPIVFTNGQARIGRPPESVLDLF